jgi:hypothetical protein
LKLGLFRVYELDFRIQVSSDFEEPSRRTRGSI